MIIFANAGRLLRSQFLRQSEILSCENDKDKEFETQTTSKMKLLFGSRIAEQSATVILLI